MWWIVRSARDFPKHTERSELISFQTPPLPESRAERTIHLLHFGNSFCLFFVSFVLFVVQLFSGVILLAASRLG